jgi:hypothetical protein
MIGFTWLQWRTQAAVAATGLVLVAIAMAITGPHLAHLYHTNVAPCAAHGDCSAAISAFLKNDSTLHTWLGVLVVAVPGITGIFWGAPLIAREFETGTYRLAWTQSVTRTRWLAVKLGVIGLASMAVAGLLSLMVTWWASPIDRANMNIYKSFDQHDIVPIGYAALAFVLGVTAGLLIRRTLPAMATTLGVFVFVRLAITHWVRPHVIAPVHTAIALNTVDPGALGYGSTGSGPATLLPFTPNIPNAWTYSTRLVDTVGHALTPQVVATTCPTLASGGQSGGPPPGAGSFHTQVPASAQAALRDCVAKIGATYHEVVTYQPGSRYWAFQWYELTIYLAAVGALAAFCFWWVRRRRA